MKQISWIFFASSLFAARTCGVYCFFHKVWFVYLILRRFFFFFSCSPTPTSPYQSPWIFHVRPSLSLSDGHTVKLSVYSFATQLHTHHLI